MGVNRLKKRRLSSNCTSVLADLKEYSQRQLNGGGLAPEGAVDKVSKLMTRLFNIRIYDLDGDVDKDTYESLKKEVSEAKVFIKNLLG